ncbi:MAG: aldehyde dehydrogenase family protein [Rhodospirillaceae bacterium]|nr:MAG: aldehyde dehydrogenase family protein [Rhodospirillaceae bacterium]
MVTLPEAKLYINGVVRKAAGNKTYDTISPWTGEVIGKAADASPADVEEAIATARRAFDETDWSTNHQLRHGLLTKLRDLLVANRQRLSDIALHEIGAALGFIPMAQVDGAVQGFSTLLEVFKTVKWEEDRGRIEFYGMKTDRITVHEAVGVVGAITPWNVPLYVNIAKVASGLLAGCTVILKPAPNTPSMATIMGELAAEAGFPAGVFSVISSKDPVVAGEMLVTDPRVDLITFTGSTGVGKRIMEKGGSTLKRVFLELGGKSANIVLDDTPDFAQVVGRSALATCSHAGQGCAIPTRLLVPQSRYAEAVAAIEQSYTANASAWGDPKQPTHVMGPLISKAQLDRVMGYIELGKKEGARLLAGGKARPDKGGGFFVEPTCFVDVKNSMRIAQEEIFGPVMVVIPFKDDEDAIRIANESDYGLAGMVTSGDKARATRIARRIRAGNISVNGGIMITPDMPFGGYKRSGIGREWGREGIEEYMETKVIATGA